MDCQLSCGSQFVMSAMKQCRWWSIGVLCHVVYLVIQECTGRIYCLHLQPWRWRQYVPLKHWQTAKIQHRTRTQKTTNYIHSALKISNPTYIQHIRPTGWSTLYMWTKPISDGNERLMARQEWSIKHKLENILREGLQVLVQVKWGKGQRQYFD
jgi:hypothetical protein